MPKNPWLDDDGVWDIPMPNKRSVVLLLTIVLASLALFGIMGA